MITTYEVFAIGMVCGALLYMEAIFICYVICYVARSIIFYIKRKKKLKKKINEND